MSGIEILGAFAAATQLIHTTCQVTQALREVRKDDPCRMQSLDKDLTILGEIISQIPLETSTLSQLLEIIRTKIKTLSGYASKYKLGSNLSCYQKLSRTFNAIRLESEIARHFTDLESYKTTLILQVSTLVAELHRHDTCPQPDLSSTKPSHESVSSETTKVPPSAVMPQRQSSPCKWPSPSQIFTSEEESFIASTSDPKDILCRSSDNTTEVILSHSRNPQSAASKPMEHFLPRIGEFLDTNVVGKGSFIGNTDIRTVGGFRDVTIDGDRCLIGQHDANGLVMNAFAPGKESRAKAHPECPSTTSHQNVRQTSAYFLQASIVGRSSIIGCNDGEFAVFQRAHINGENCAIGNCDEAVIAELLRQSADSHQDKSPEKMHMSKSEELKSKSEKLKSKSEKRKSKGKK